MFLRRRAGCSGGSDRLDLHCLLADSVAAVIRGADTILVLLVADDARIRERRRVRVQVGKHCPTFRRSPAALDLISVLAVYVVPIDRHTAGKRVGVDAT